jgi:methylthioribulose-1-phosphate dehydratase
MSKADDLARASRRLYALGWMRGTSGNVSVRDGSEILVTASGIDKSSVDASDAVLIDASGVALPGQERRPSAEAPVHAAVIAEAGAGAVVHVHSLAAVEAAARWPDGVPLVDVEQLKGIGRGAHGDVVVVPVVANSQDMSDLSDRILAASDPSVPGVIVAEHGLYAWGASLGEAIDRTESFDWLFEHALRLDRLRRPGG